MRRLERRKSEHPLATAIVRYAADRGINPLPLNLFRNVPGHGAAALVQARRIAVGNRKLLVGKDADFGTLMDRRDASWPPVGARPCSSPSTAGGRGDRSG